MGIKGRRKKLRLREIAAKEARARQEEDGSGDDVDDEFFHDDGVEEELPMGGSGPFQLPVTADGQLRIKKSELYKMRDLDYLDRIREEHEGRRKSHMAGQKRKREREAAEEEEAEVPMMKELLRDAHEVEELLHPGKARTSQRAMSAMEKELEKLERRRTAGTGALFSHPLMGLHPAIAHALSAEGFVRMTPIQERCVPYAMNGYDLLGQARTGSGKTLAFCLPLLHGSIPTLRQHPNATVGLLMAPTKELCVQTHDILVSITKHIPSSVARFTVQLITGGTSVQEERRRLVEGVSIAVGTPGRLHDHVRHTKAWNLAHLRFLVLDEADRMLADGFQRDLDAIIPALPKSRQTCLFSATNSKSVRELARLSLSRTPIFISTSNTAPQPISDVGEEGSSSLSIASSSLPPYQHFDDPSDGDDDEDEGDDDVADNDDEEHSDHDEDSNHDEEDGEAIPSTLAQYCHIVPVEDRLRALYVFTKRIARTSKAMIFCSTVASTIFHCQMMGSVGFHDEVMMLHGHMKHRQRLQAFRAFTEWPTGVLFCTDVAARGLDIPNVEWILQYDAPLDPTEYIHRIGRTARAGSVGSALLFLTPEEVRFVRYLSQYGIHLTKYPMPDVLPAIQAKLTHVLELDDVVAKSAVSAFRAQVGAYQSHVLKEIFDVNRVDVSRLATAFALSSAPHVSLPKNTVEEKKQEYVKGKLKSLNRRRIDALRSYDNFKTRPQWSAEGHFVGSMKPM